MLYKFSLFFAAFCFIAADNTDAEVAIDTIKAPTPTLSPIPEDNSSGGTEVKGKALGDEKPFEGEISFETKVIVFSERATKLLAQNVSAFVHCKALADQERASAEKPTVPSKADYELDFGDRFTYAKYTNEHGFERWELRTTGRTKINDVSGEFTAVYRAERLKRADKIEEQQKYLGITCQEPEFTHTVAN